MAKKKTKKKTKKKAPKRKQYKLVGLGSGKPRVALTRGAGWKLPAKPSRVRWRYDPEAGIVRMWVPMSEMTKAEKKRAPKSTIAGCSLAATAPQVGRSAKRACGPKGVRPSPAGGAVAWFKYHGGGSPPQINPGNADMTAKQFRAICDLGSTIEIAIERGDHSSAAALRQAWKAARNAGVGRNNLYAYATHGEWKHGEIASKGSPAKVDAWTGAKTKKKNAKRKVPAGVAKRTRQSAGAKQSRARTKRAAKKSVTIAGVRIGK